MNKALKFGIILILGVLAMSSGAIFVRLAQADNVPSLTIASYRLIVATIVLSFPAIRQRVWTDYAKLSRRDLSVLIVSGILLGLHFATWITSLSHTSVVSSLVLVTSTPVWVAVVSPSLLHEPTPKLAWIGIITSVVGGTIIAIADWDGGESSRLWGNLLATAGAILMAGYLLIGRRVRNQLSLIAYLWIVYGTAAVLLLGWSIFAGLKLTGFSINTVGWLIALGLIPQLIGHTAANYSVRHISATLVAVVMLGEPIGSTVLAIVVLNEWPIQLQIIGGIFILTGIILASFAEERMKSSA